MRIRDLSLAVRFPLSLVAACLLTAVVLSVVIAGLTWRNVRAELRTSNANLARAAAQAVAPALQHGDVWEAYRVLNASVGPAGGALALVLVTPDGMVFAASDPRRFATARTLPPLRSLSGADGSAPELVSVPVNAAGAQIGTLLALYSHHSFWPRLEQILADAAGWIAGVAVVLSIVGWGWGRREARPLALLAERMREVGRLPPDELAAGLTRSGEIGLLARRFREMAEAAQARERLQQEAMVAERLAALGRLAAGIAHEVNNPLAGMQLAVDTARRQSGARQPELDRTLALLQRGLEQIRRTVGALLVQVRDEPRPLAPQDLEDVRVLAAAHQAQQVRHLEWHNRLPSPVPVPAGPMRQVALNLLNNAVRAAAAADGWVRFECALAGDALTLDVENHGPVIAQDVLERMFEPLLASASNGGHGLGLWMTYQVVTQLGGTVECESEDGRTRFSVRVPVTQAGQAQEVA